MTQKYIYGKMIDFVPCIVTGRLNFTGLSDCNDVTRDKIIAYIKKNRDDLLMECLTETTGEVEETTLEELQNREVIEISRNKVIII